MKKLFKIGLALVVVFILSLTAPIFNVADTVAVAMAASTSPKTAVEEVTLYVGYKTYQIKFENLSKKATVTFKTSNSKVAKVSDAGIITPIAKGTANVTITMKQNSKTYTSTIKVTVGVPNIKFTAKTKQLNVGDTYTYKAKAYGTSGSIVWSTSSTKVAKINSSTGKLTAVAAGEVDVIATAGSISSRYTLTVDQCRFSTDSTNLEIFDQTIIYIKFKDLKSDETISVDSGDADIVTCKWGEWSGDTLPLLINPKKVASTTVTISTNSGNDKLAINVKVIKKPTTRDKKAKVLTAKEIYQKCAPATVELQVTTIDGEEYIGSGFFIQSGVIVTNYHVIAGATKVVVVTYDNKTYDMYAVLGYNVTNDIAIINIDAVTPYLTRNKGIVTVGDEVYALGSPRGLSGSLSDGIVSSSSRIIEDVDYIQITAPVSNGNSGGPLINEYGEVIGINTFMIQDSQNLNFAINISQYNKVDVNNGVIADEYYKAIRDAGIREDENRSGNTDTLQNVPSDVLVSGALHPANRIDGYRFTLAEAGTFEAILVAEAEYGMNYTFFSITDTDMNIVVDSSFGVNAEGQYREITANLAAGEYYVMIYYEYDLEQTTNYLFALEY